MPWRRFPSSPTTWLLWAQYFCLSYGWYFYPTWLPAFCRTRAGRCHGQGAFLAGLPLFFGGIGCLVSGFLSARLARRIGTAWARKLIACRGLTGACLMLLLSVQARGADLGDGRDGDGELLQRPRDALGVGRLHGRGRALRRHLLRQHEHDGQPRRRAGPIVVGYILQATSHNWALTFYVSAAVYLLGAVSGSSSTP